MFVWGWVMDCVAVLRCELYVWLGVVPLGLWDMPMCGLCNVCSANLIIFHVWWVLGFWLIGRCYAWILQLMGSADV